MNGWNLKITQLKKENHVPKLPFVGFMFLLIFQSVIKIHQSSPITNQPHRIHGYPWHIYQHVARKCMVFHVDFHIPGKHEPPMDPSWEVTTTSTIPTTHGALGKFCWGLSYGIEQPTLWTNCAGSQRGVVGKVKMSYCDCTLLDASQYVPQTEQIFPCAVHSRKLTRNPKIGGL